MAWKFGPKTESEWDLNITAFIFSAPVDAIAPKKKL